MHHPDRSRFSGGGQDLARTDGARLARSPTIERAGKRTGAPSLGYFCEAPAVSAVEGWATTDVNLSVPPYPWAKTAFKELSSSGQRSDATCTDYCRSRTSQLGLETRGWACPPARSVNRGARSFRAFCERGSDAAGCRFHDNTTLEISASRRAGIRARFVLAFSTTQCDI